MSFHRRYSLLPALLLALLAAGCGGDKSVQIDPALATLIPAGSNALAGIRMDEVRNTPVYQKWFAERPLPGLEDLTQETGIDAKKDIWEVLLASGPAGSVALARGKFSEQGLEPRLKREGVTRTQYQGYTIVGDEEDAITFMNASTAIAGKPDMVRAVIDQRSARQNASRRDLLDKAKAIPRGTQIWMVSLGGVTGREIPKTGNMVNLGKLSASVESATAVVQLSSGIKTELNAACKTAADAKELDDTLRALLGIARAMTPEVQREMRSLYDAVRVVHKDTAVTVGADLSPQMVDALMTKFFARQPGS